MHLFLSWVVEAIIRQVLMMMIRAYTYTFPPANLKDKKIRDPSSVLGKETFFLAIFAVRAC